MTASRAAVLTRPGEIVLASGRSPSRRRWCSAMRCAAAIALAASGPVDLESLITEHFGLADTAAALRAGRENPRSVKAIVYP